MKSPSILGYSFSRRATYVGSSKYNFGHKDARDKYLSIIAQENIEYYHPTASFIFYG